MLLSCIVLFLPRACVIPPDRTHPKGTQIRLIEPIHDIASGPNEKLFLSVFPEKAGIRIVGYPRVIPNPIRRMFFTVAAIT